MKRTLGTVVAAFILVSGLVLLPSILNNRSFAILSSNTLTSTPVISLSPSPSQLAPTLQQYQQQQQQPMKPMDLNFVIGPGLQEVQMQKAATMVQQGAHLKKVTLVAYERNVTLPQGNQIHALTFNGTIPSPTIRVTQGDILNVTTINYPKNKLIHSLDHHASIISAVPNFGPIKVGAQKNWAFVATQPGFFKYHCEGNGVLTMDQHVFQGMSGGVIVDPVKGYTGYSYPTYDDKGNAMNQTVKPNAKEIAFVFSEWYLDKKGDYNQTAMNEHIPTYATINGIPFGYEPVVTKTKNAMPIHIKQGDHVRFFLLNIGDEMVNFHIVGEQLDRVTDGSVIAGWGKQTYLVGGSNDAIVDVVFNKPGAYAPVNHDYADLFKGQIGIIVVDGPDGQPGKSLGLKDYKNPSNAIPPMGKDSIAVETTPYTLGAPISWNGQNGTAITNATTPAPLAAGGNATSATGAGNSTQSGNSTAGAATMQGTNVTTPSGGAPTIPPAASAPGNAPPGANGSSAGGTNASSPAAGGSTVPGVTQ
jgi:nitrite reductase (NO-forming)